MLGNTGRILALAPGTLSGPLSLQCCGSGVMAIHRTITLWLWPRVLSPGHKD